MSHACAIRTDGSAVCWGLDQFGQSTPAEGKYVHLSGGYSFTCGILENQSIECWGSDDLNQLQPPPGSYVRIAAGNAHACAIRSNGNLSCWGWNDYEQATAPVGTFRHVAADVATTCGVKESGAVECWGEQAYVFPFCESECGDGETSDGEGCDDGNASFVSGEACSAACQRVPCGQPVAPGADGPLVSDALFTLRASVGSTACSDDVCDVNASGSITTVDALLVLKRAVGQAVDLPCGAG